MKFLRTLAVAAIAVICAASCETGGGLSDLRDRIDALEKSNIPTMGEQMLSVSKSLESLHGTQETLLKYITNLQGEVNDLEKGITPDTRAIIDELKVLKEEFESFSKAIEDLEAYADDQDSAVKDWVKTTFATLDQYETIQGELSKLKSTVESLSSFDELEKSLSQNITDSISKSEDSIKGWIDDKLKGYYTIAEIDAKLSSLETGSSNGGSAAVDETAREQIGNLEKALEDAKGELEKAYKEAIEEAITKNNGVIEGTIASKIAEANTDLDETIKDINLKIGNIEDRLQKVEDAIKALLSRIQSITVIPEYSDGSVGIANESKTIKFEIYPLEAAEELAKLGTDVLSLKAVYTKTKSVEVGDFANLDILSCSYESGVFSISTVGANLDDAFFNNEVGASARLLATLGGASAISPYFTLTAE